MRMVLCGTAIAAACVFAPIASAQSVSGFGAYESERQFRDQSVKLPKAPAAVAGLTATWDTLYVDFWNAESKAVGQDEFDFTVGNIFALDENTTLDVNGAIFVIDGPEAYRLQATLSHKLSDTLSVSGNVQVIRGGFETEVVKGLLSNSFPVGGTPLTLSLEGGLAYDTWSERLGAQGSAGASISLGPKVSLDFSVSGFSAFNSGAFATEDTSSVMGSVGLSFVS